MEGTILEAEKKGYVSDGDINVITAGMPLGKSGTTNMIRVHKVGEEYR